MFVLALYYRRECRRLSGLGWLAIVCVNGYSYSGFAMPRYDMMKLTWSTFIVFRRRRGSQHTLRAQAFFQVRIRQGLLHGINK